MINRSMQQVALLAMLLAVCARGSSAASCVYPFCRCDDYSPSASPFALTATGPFATPGGEVEVDLVLETKTPGNPSSTCAQILTDEGMDKMTIHTSSVCVNHVKVFIDGKLCTSCKAQPPANADCADKAYIHIVFRPFLLPTPGSKHNIKLIGSGPCSSGDTLLVGGISNYEAAFFNYGKNPSGTLCCPKFRPPPSHPVAPPPSPSQPSQPDPPTGRPPYPHAQCGLHGMRGIPFGVAFSKQGSQHCMTVVRNPNCDGSVDTDKWQQSCCDASFNKIEFLVNKQCQKSIGAITVDGAPASPVRAVQQGHYVVRITPLPFTNANAAGHKVCFSLTQPGCTTPEAVFENFLVNPAGVTYAIFGDHKHNGVNVPHACCGVDTVPYRTLG